MKLPYPKKCDQKWLEMEENDQGRLCSKCENTIIDFRNSTWNQIRQAQFNSNYTTCGLYSKKQLKNWDPEKEYKTSIHAAAATVLLSITQLISNEGLAQDTNLESPIHVVDDSTKIESQKTTQYFEIIGNVRDAENGEQLPFVKIRVDNSKYGASTDFEGNFKIVIPITVFNRNIISITTSYPRYESITTSDISLSESKTTTVNFILEKSEAELSYFVIEAPSKRDIRRAKKAKKKEEKRFKE